MRNVEKEKDINGNIIVPAILNNHEINSEWEKIAREELKPPDIMKISKEVINELNKYYLGKCAYCESDCIAEVEHYRPKNHYFWLYYEWTNLLPACHDCNTFAGGKGNQFTTQGSQETLVPFLSGKLNKQACVANNVPLKKEKPNLLHPEYDEPKNYLKFKINDLKQGIDISEMNNEERGKETIRICNLNRVPLRWNRQEYVVEPIVERLRDTLSECKDNGLKYHQIIKALIKKFVLIEQKVLNINLQFTLLYSFIMETYENFVSIILPYYEDDEETKLTISEAFKKYKTI
jgi:uncharacterized protein (TIGR02646 family)